MVIKISFCETSHGFWGALLALQRILRVIVSKGETLPPCKLNVNELRGFRLHHLVPLCPHVTCLSVRKRTPAKSDQQPKYIAKRVHNGSQVPRRFFLFLGQDFLFPMRYTSARHLRSARKGPFDCSERPSKRLARAKGLT